MIIYKITNTINNKIYIGQTTRSLNERKSEYKRLKFYNDHLHASIIKYGFQNFSFEVIDVASSIEELNKKEIYWINHYRSTDKTIGYNILDGGRNSLKPFEVKFKMSNAHKGTKQSKEWINKRIAQAGSDDAKKYGKEKTEEDKKRLSENSPKFWLGKSRAQETKDKISKSKQGHIPPNRKPVFKIQKRTNLLLAMYNSTSEAAEMNPNYSQSKISRICNNKVKSKEDFTFSFSHHG